MSYTLEKTMKDEMDIPKGPPLEVSQAEQLSAQQ